MLSPKLKQTKTMRTNFGEERTYMVPTVSWERKLGPQEDFEKAPDFILRSSLNRNSA